MANINSNIERMQQLIAFGQNTNKTTANAKPVLEHSVKAADGNTYGILHECNKYYVMVAPPKNSAILAEDFAHIDGVNNRKNHEYTSYSTAMQNLELKVRSVNESVSAKAKTKEFAPVVLKEEKDWQTSITQETRKEIERFKQIVENVNLIENNYVPSAHTLPEAPAKNPSDEQVHTPFTDTAVAKGDKEFTKTETNPATAGGPFENSAKVEMESDKKPSGNGEDTYSQDAKYVPDGSVANQKPSGGKVTRADESKRHIIVTEEQVLAWNKNKDYMDTSKGTEIGNTAPFTDKTEAPIQEEEGIAVHNTDNINKPTPGTSEVGDTAPFDNKVNESDIDPADVVGMPADIADDNDDNDVFNINYEEWLNDDESKRNFLGDDLTINTEIEDEEIPSGPFGESKAIKGRKVLGESAENGDWHGVPGARFIWHGEWADPEIEYNGRFINYWVFANFFENDEEEENASPEEVKAILDDILFGMSEGEDGLGESRKRGVRKVNEGFNSRYHRSKPSFINCSSPEEANYKVEVQNEWFICVYYVNANSEKDVPYMILDYMHKNNPNRFYEDGDNTSYPSEHPDKYYEYDGWYFYKDNFDIQPIRGEMGESRKRYGRSRRVNEGQVDLGYGKHPAYQKAPMTTPPNKEVAKDGYRDWNDDSAKGDKPFGTQIGDRAPYDQLVQAITDSLMKKLNFQSKA